jgi:NAD(P)-dependent dehydrogenase (short-subunit alcohol dehydrogenase family)
MALRFLHSQLFVTLPVPEGSYTGKTIIITGSNTGLGLEAARHFTSLGASTVVLAVRSLSKGETAKADIEATTGRHDVIKVMHLDMSSYDSVLSFASAVSTNLPRVDIAILNAGVARGVWETAEGHESTITVNVLSTFLLAFALLPHMIATSKKHNTRPTLSITASEVHEFADFPERTAPKGKIFAHLDQQQDANGKDKDMGNRYQVSKLLEILCVRCMATTSNIPVTINCINPGLCHSELSRESGWGLYILKLLLARTSEVGSRALVHAGSAGEQSHGTYLSDCTITEPAAWVGSEEGREVQGRVWEEVRGILESVKEGITRI